MKIFFFNFDALNQKLKVQDFNDSRVNPSGKEKLLKNPWFFCWIPKIFIGQYNQIISIFFFYKPEWVVRMVFSRWSIDS